MEETYDRQKDMKLNIPDTVAVIGVGGIGSWVAIDLALVGVKNIVLVDQDRIEEHNRNRTLFRTFDVGLYKVDALKVMISELREHTKVIAYNKKVEDLTAAELHWLENSAVVIDARDTVSPLPSSLKNVVKVGYDGTHFTIDYREHKAVWGESHGYTVTPSFFATPQLVAALVVGGLVTGSIERKAYTGDLKEIWRCLE